MEDKQFIQIITSLHSEIRENVRLMNKHNKEHGFVICRRDDNVRLGERCVGEKCGVELKPCPMGEITLASFHTHPSNYVTPNEMDVMVSYVKGEEFFCIANKETKTRCWRIVANTPEFKRFSKNVIDGQTNYKPMLKAMKQLSNDLFLKKNKIIRQVTEFDANKYVW